MKITVIILNILLLLGLFPSLLFAMMSPMIFDAGVTSRRSWAAGMIIALPLAIIIAEIVSWIAFYKGNYNLALKASIAPFIFGIFTIITLLIID